MSIISEALKKAEKSSSSCQRPILSSFSDTKKSHLRLWLLLALAILSIVFALQNLIPILIKQLAPQKTKKEIVSTTLSALSKIDFAFLNKSKNSSKKIALPTPRLHTEISSDLRLSGIALIEGKSYAIINGGIFQEGDKILEAQIIQISEDSVKVARDGKELRLSLH